MKPPAPPPSLRDRQREETREHILRAVGHQLEQGPLEDLSFAEIAKEMANGGREALFTGATSKAEYTVSPSGEKTLPPWLDCKLKLEPGVMG